MKIQGIVLFLSFTVTVVITQTPDPVISGETQLSPTQTVLLKHAVKDLLGFSQIPPTPGPKVENKGKKNSFISLIDDDEAPQYMMDLYEKYKYGKISKGRKTGNTVRSIKAQIGVVNGEATVLFNLSSINPSESVFDGEIHVHRRKRKNDLHLMLTQVAPLRHVPLETVQMTGSKAGWQSFDVTVALKALLAPKRAGIHLMAAKFVRKDGRRVNIKRVMKSRFKPFLIVFSNDTQNITLDHMEPYFSPKDLKQPMIDPETGNEIRSHRKKNRRRPPLKEAPIEKGSLSVAPKDSNDVTSPFTAATHVTTFKDAETSRNRRSIFDNEIPHGPAAESIEPEAAYNMPPTHAGVMQGKKDDADSSTTSSRFLPYPDNYKERRDRRRKNRRKNRRKEKTLPLPAEWEALARQQENRDNIIPAMHHRPALCGRNKLVVDFADIGWSDWIISPKSFEAHYCAGQCPFPLTKGLRPSNHATIQSLVHAIGIRANVPAPCCVPDVMSSVTLLYFDEHRNVVLKNYPSMTVQSCACR